jgi:hypothetical protein
MTTRRTKSGHVICGWNDDWTMAYVYGHGWCRYSAKPSAIMIQGHWHTY